jgi:hypothetical protein
LRTSLCLLRKLARDIVLAIIRGTFTALAIAISYTNNHSVLWAIIHGFFSWLYVIYYVLFK